MRRTAGLTLALIAMVAIAVFPARTWAQGFDALVLSNLVSSAYSSAVGDFDDDGDNDVVVSTGQPGGVLFWIETLASGQRATRTVAGGSGSFRNLAAGDFNGDGIPDVVVSDFAWNEFLLLTAHGNGGLDPFTVSTLRDSCGRPFAVSVADMDGDGDEDVVTAEWSANVVRGFRQESGVLTEIFAVGDVWHPYDLALVDYDLDGDMDAVAATDHGLDWLEQVTLTNWVRHDVTANSELTLSCGAGDIDHDGDIDLLGGFRTASNPRVSWFEHGTFVEHIINDQFYQPRGIETADFDSDGDVDVAAISQTGTIRWWRNGGTGTLTQLNIAGGASLWGLTLSDYDNDGDQDLLAADHDAGLLNLYSNVLGIPAVIMGTVRAAREDVVISGMVVRLVENGIRTETDASGQFTIFTAPGVFTLETASPCWADTQVVALEAVRAETLVVDLALRRPQIEVEVSSLNIIASNQMETTESLPIFNSGDSPLHVTTNITGNFPNDPWLSVTPTEAIIQPDETFSFVVHVAPDTLNNAGFDYSGVVRLNSDACPDSVVDVRIVVFVMDADQPSLPVPENLAITSVYPNPFNSRTTIEFSLPRPAMASLKVISLLGRESAVVAESHYSAGVHQVIWDADNVSSGVYFLALESDQERSVQKIVLLK